MNAKELKLDYFLLYDAVNQKAGYVVGLQGQFDKQPEKNQLTALNAFATWVSKNGEPVNDKNAHLNWYDLYDPVPDPTRLIYFQNQFGEQKIITGRAIALLAPAEKVEEGAAFPKYLDHYKVYQVLDGQPANKTVELEDQFGKSKAEISYPYAFAVPVVKWYQGDTTKIKNDKAHLVFYRMTPKSLQQNRLVYDQFGRRYMQIFRTVLLGVPSVKLNWQEF